MNFFLKSLISILLTLFFIENLNAQVRKVYNCQYLLKVTNSILKSNDTLATKMNIPMTVNLKLNVITDGEDYFVRGEVESAEVASVPLDLVTDEGLYSDDSVLIRKRFGIAYLFKNKTFASYETKDIGITGMSIDPEKKNILRQKIESMLLIQDSSYQYFITPFPQFIGNKFGIVEVQSTNSNNQRINCTLQNVKEIEFNFLEFFKKTNSFTKSEIKIPLPF